MTRRTKVDGNLAVARATAARVASALGERRPSPVGHRPDHAREAWSRATSMPSPTSRISPSRTRDRYRAAPDRFLGFCDDAGIAADRRVDERTVEDFVRWLRGQTRTRNGAAKGKREPTRPAASSSS